MKDLLEAIDDAWFSDANSDMPASAPHPIKSFRRPAPGMLTPMPIPGHTALAPEALIEFGRPSLALGTQVDFPAPDYAWFSEMRSLVPRRLARSSTIPPMAPKHSVSPSDSPCGNQARNGA